MPTPTPTPTPTPPPPTPTPPPPTYYPHVGTDCNGASVTIYTTNSGFSVSNTAYSDSEGQILYTGIFVYGNIINTYTDGNGTGGSATYSHTGTDCNGNSVTIYTNQSGFTNAYTAYSDLCLTTYYTGYFVYSGIVYSYINGTGTPLAYAHSVTDCNGDPATIYTNAASFSASDTAYSGPCLTTVFNGVITNGGAIYKYSSGSSTRYYTQSGTNCDSDPVTIYISNSIFNNSNTAYDSSCISTLYNGYFIYASSTYLYTDGVGVSSSCPSPPSTYTDPNILRADIHSSYATGSGTWQTYRASVTGLFAANSGTNQSDYRDHVIREFNRKISILNQPTGLFISPYDDGFRFTGVSI